MIKLPHSLFFLPFEISWNFVTVLGDCGLNGPSVFLIFGMDLSVNID